MKVALRGVNYEGGENYKGGSVGRELWRWHCRERTMEVAL